MIGLVSERTNAIANATARNVSPSTTTTASIPATPTTTPPSGDPMRRARLALIEVAALATVN